MLVLVREYNIPRDEQLRVDMVEHSGGEVVRLVCEKVELGKVVVHDGGDHLLLKLLWQGRQNRVLVVHSLM